MPNREASPAAKRLSDYQPPSFLIDEVVLDFDLRESGTRVRSRLTVRRNPAGPGARDLRLDGEELRLMGIRLNGHELTPLGYVLESDGLVVQRVPDTFVLETEVEISPEKKTALEGLYRSGSMFCTQCEAEGFRRITYFLDRPDVMARFRTTLKADKARYPVLLSNGNPVSAEDLPDGRHCAVWEDPFPKPCYLFALVAGDLRFIEDRHVTASGRDVVGRSSSRRRGSLANPS